MKKQLKDLVTLQELDALLDELDGAQMREQEGALGFALGETDRLRATRAKLASGLRPEILQRYETVRRRHARAVVPSSRGVCMGCFTRRATAMATSHDETLEVCERCARILYRLDETAAPAAPPPPAAKPSAATARKTPTKRARRAS
jgi:predicted  nucleic acid-binding Zn-ribbon protein